MAMFPRKGQGGKGTRHTHTAERIRSGWLQGRRGLAGSRYAYEIDNVGHVDRSNARQISRSRYIGDAPLDRTYVRARIWRYA